jgi:pimeloyl-ACP methyl ester carboxylesterase
MDPAIRKLQAPPPGAADPWVAFKGIQCPVLVLRGEKSDVLSPATARAMSEALPDCRVVEVPGVGHAPVLVEPVAKAALVEFLSAE